MKLIKEQIIQEIFKHFSNYPDIWVADKEIYAPKLEELENILLGVWINKYRYRAEVFDCDDFCWVFKGWISQEAYRQKWKTPWCVGITWGDFDIGAHAKCWVILEDIGLVFFEPQTEEIQKDIKKGKIIAYETQGAQVAENFFVGSWTRSDQPWFFIV